MKFEKLTDRTRVCGTSLAGYLRGVSEEALTKAFGRPGPGCGKSEMEWYVEVSDSSFPAPYVLTIYDWLGSQWHVGAHRTGWNRPAMSDSELQAVLSALAAKFPGCSVSTR